MAGSFPDIPGCKIVSILGEGGMSTVYLGIQERLKRKVAIKALESKMLKDPDTAKRFEKEAKTAANLSHSNIIQIFDTDKTSDGNYYIVMEYLEKSLKEHLQIIPGGKMHPKSTVNIAKNIFKALDYAHLNGVFHRDVKPDNIMFRKDDTPVLVDFGISKVLTPKGEMTDSNLSLGTSYYMSPEQCKAMLEIDGRSDVYSLGVVFFEMLTGNKPYEGKSQIAIALKHMKDPIPKLPKELIYLQPLINHMMAKDRGNRLSSTVQFTKLIDHILERIQWPRRQTTEIQTVEAGKKEVPQSSRPSSYLTKKSSSSHSEPSYQSQTIAEPDYESQTSSHMESDYPQHSPEKQEPIVNKYFNIADKKARKFVKTIFLPWSIKYREKTITIIKEKLWPFLKNLWLDLKKLWKWFSEISLQLKLAITSPIIIILLVLVWSLTSSSPQQTASPNPNHPVLKLWQNFIAKHVSIQGILKSYEENLHHEIDPEELEKALRSVNELKTLYPGLELDTLKQKIKKRHDDIKHKIYIQQPAAPDKGEVH